MIKILKNTMIDPIECTCPTCSSVFTYNYEDLEREEKENTFGYRIGPCVYIICPVCKSSIDRMPICKMEDKKK